MKKIQTTEPCSILLNVCSQLKHAVSLIKIIKIAICSKRSKSESEAFYMENRLLAQRQAIH